MANKINISDELLAAYLDANTNEAETLEVLYALRKNPELQEVLDIALSVEEEKAGPYDMLPMMKLAAESGNNICCVLCEAFVLHHRGISFDDSNLLHLAQQNHRLTPQGTPLYAIGQLLAHYDLMVTRKYDATIDDITKALFKDNDVLVVVDNDKLYERREDLEDAPNHAVVVLEIQQDEVRLFDPSTPDINVIVSMPYFIRAWRESHNYMVCVLQSINDYKPQPITLDNIQLTDELYELQEAIAENCHEIWAATRIKEGWTYGKERNDRNKKHPDLVPYSALSDGEKEYDRLMALDTIKLVKKLGYEILKK